MKSPLKIFSGPEARSARQAVVLYGATLFGVLLGIFSSVINTRFLSPSAYGDVRYVMNIIGYVGTFLFIGHFYAGSRLLAVSREEGEARRIRGALVLLTAVLSLALMAAAALCGVFHGRHDLQVLFVLSVPVCLQPLLYNYIYYVLPGDNQIWRVAISRFLPTLLYIPAAYWLFTATGASSQKMLLLQWGIATLVFVVIIASTRPRFAGCRPVFADLRRENREYGRQLYFSLLISVATNNLAGVTLGLFNADNATVGFYTLALTVTFPLSTLPAIVGTTYFKQFASQPRIPRKVLNITFLATAATCLAFVLLIKPLVVFLYTEQYRVVGIFAQWMSLSFCLHGLGDMFNRYLASHGQGRPVRNASLASGIVKLVGFTLMVWLWNTTGALVALTLSEFLYFVMLWGSYHHFVKSDAEVEAAQ